MRNALAHAGRSLNTQLQDWLGNVANVRLHATTQKIVSEAFAADQLDLQPLPAMPFDALLKLELSNGAQYCPPIWSAPLRGDRIRLRV
jgi:hypothetical protein